MMYQAVTTSESDIKESSSLLEDWNNKSILVMSILRLENNMK